MTRDEIDQMARKTGFTIHTDDSVYMEMLHSFATLVAAAEREACAKVCEAYGTSVTTKDCAAALRARSKA